MLKSEQNVNTIAQALAPGIEAYVQGDVFDDLKIDVPQVRACSKKVRLSSTCFLKMFFDRFCVF